MLGRKCPSLPKEYSGRERLKTRKDFKVKISLSANPVKNDLVKGWLDKDPESVAESFTFRKYKGITEGQGIMGNFSV